MTPNRKIVISQSTSPYENLAIEKYLTGHLGEDEVILFLWKNIRIIIKNSYFKKYY